MGNKDVKETLRQQVNELSFRVKGEVEEILGEIVLSVDGGRITETLKAIKNFPDVPCDFLASMGGMDLGDRMAMVYHLTSWKGPQRMRVKAMLDRVNPVIDSITSLWVGSDYLEREAFDMFGIVFKGHPNLKRIFLWDSFEGHHLRKDFVPESDEARKTMLIRQEGD